ncbi:hypothetical protein L873DRAFT_1772830 [Choiromyces venosus 120613-1]|uniref:AA1-like domain-containing protein n=1 Tax=Choiromyces venosus 120613-1 TaxID=1336337 RepID=A0A3N4JEB6_9PEZI|nr:hypothetical protein L873DRAFT_1772830 [Choiromyces venosus 120613-1]
MYLPHHFSLLAILLLFQTISTTARCTINYNTSFTLTTYNSLTPTLNDLQPYLSRPPHSQLTISPAARPSPVSVTPFFYNGGIYRFADGSSDVEQGYLFKKPGGPNTGYAFRFGCRVPPGAITGRFEIGCNERGRHILSLNGELEWQTCGGGHHGEWTINRGVNDGVCAAADVRFWVDYIRPL